MSCGALRVRGPWWARLVYVVPYLTNARSALLGTPPAIFCHVWQRSSCGAKRVTSRLAAHKCWRRLLPPCPTSWVPAGNCTDPSTVPETAHGGGSGNVGAAG